MTFYLKYRSQTLETLDLTDVRETLKKIVTSGNIPHALLFAGPKGTGKTSAARILAKVINCESRKDGEIEPCNTCSQCVSITRGENLDVIELDAASNRGIDDVRVLRETVKLSPASAKKKIYIIDEAHMLTAEASNALLKTLEEPPTHVLFILATTNPEKLIGTIRSRTTLVQFKKATSEEVVRSLQRVVEGEKLKVDAETLKIIAKAANGAFRDGHKVLDTLVADGVDLAKKELVQEFLFKKDCADPQQFLKLLQEGDAKKLVNEIENVVANGVSIETYMDSIIEELHQLLLLNINKGNVKEKDYKTDEIANLLHILFAAKSELKTALLEQVPLEIAAIEWCGKLKLKVKEGTKDESNEESKKGEKVDRKSVEEQQLKESRKNLDLESEKVEEKIEIKVKADESVKVDSDVNSEKKDVKKKVDVQIPGIPQTIAELNDSVWTKVLTEIRPKNASTEALLRASRPLTFDGKTLTLGVYYSFHKERLESQPHRIILEDTISGELGIPVRVVCTLTERDEMAEKQVAKEESPQGPAGAEVVLTESEDKDILKVAEDIFGN